jgi:hypothetical protein
MRLTSLVRACAAAFLVAAAGTASAEDVIPDDAYDVLSMAIEIDLQCTVLPYFEQRYLRVAARRAYETSAAKIAVDASADPSKAAADIEQKYRERTKATDCQNAGTYLSQGRAQAYAQLGQALLTAQHLRGQETVAPGFSPLSDEQRQLFGAFAQAGAQTFGADWTTMDGYIQQVAAARMQELATKGEAARLIELAFDWDLAFATIRFQASAAAAGYFPRLARLANGWEAIVMDGGTARPRLLVVAGPERVRVPLMSGETRQAYSLVAVLPDGGMLVGLYGEDAANLPAKVRQRLIEGVPVDGERFVDNCPFDICFGVAADRVEMLSRTFNGSYLKSIVTEWPNDAERETGGDRLSISLEFLNAALAAR